jgi:hypothetical protein
MTFFEGKHRTQFDGSTLAAENCTPTSGANGVRASTGGRIDKSGGEIRELVKNSEEQDSDTAGWSLNDLALAMKRLEVPFAIRKDTWSGVEAALRAGVFVSPGRQRPVRGRDAPGSTATTASGSTRATGPMGPGSSRIRSARRAGGRLRRPSRRMRRSSQTGRRSASAYSRHRFPGRMT